MLVPVVRPVLVDVWMRVDVVAVAVLVLVLLVLVLVRCVGVLVRCPVAAYLLVAVGVFVVVVLVMLVHRSISSGRVSCAGITYLACRASPARSNDRVVREACLEAKPPPDACADRVELLGTDRANGTAVLAVEILAFATAAQGVQAGPVAEMHMAHESMALERLEIAVHRCQVQTEAMHDVLG